MTKIYLAISIEENGKKYAQAWKLPVNRNLLNLPELFPNAVIICVCSTWTNARETVERWNAVYKANGVYMFDTPSF